MVYAGVLGNGFVDYDDDSYVTRNRTVLAGLTRAGVVWAFTTGHVGNWHPLTWLSHMLDVELWGRDPARPPPDQPPAARGERRAPLPRAAAHDRGGAGGARSSPRSSPSTRCTSSRSPGSPSARTS